jgi:2-phospho-L-lactate/phosphoenolpyruvate guanylyltransferase
MKYILISVKDLTVAKRRLSMLLTPKERTALAWRMLEHLFKEATGARGYDRIAIVTPYEPAARLGRTLGFEVISESQVSSESESVDHSSGVLAARGASSVLSLPTDLPLIRTVDIEAIGGLIKNGPSALIVPSRDGTGTNAIVRSPPDLFPSHFGPDSLVKHLAEARTRGLSCELVYLPNVALDIDNPSDVAFFLEHGQGTSTYDLLRELHIEQRLTRV